MFCASKFKEGSDIPYLSCALFLDKVKKRGEVPFIQCIGRVLRKDEERNLKKNGHIIDGCVSENNECKMKNILRKLLKYYLHLYEISKSDFINQENNYSLSRNKVMLFEEIMNGLILEPDKQRIVIKLKNDKKITINLDNVDLKTMEWNKIIGKFGISLKETLIFSEYDEFLALKKKVKNIKFQHKEDYIKDYKNYNLIQNPDEKYTPYWITWIEFLGIDTSNYIKDKNDWIKKCKKLNVNSIENYKKLCKVYDELPSMPEEFYVNFSNLPNELGLLNNRRRN